jgi:hypothetical protein
MSSVIPSWGAWHGSVLIERSVFANTLHKGMRTGCG